MTMQSSETVVCPACRHEQAYTVWNTLNVTLNPELKERLFAGELTALTCARCGQKTEVVHSLLYHDMDKQFMIWLVPGDDYPEPIDAAQFGAMGEEACRNYRFRLVRGRNDLREKVRIFEDDLDDRILEFLKGFVRNGQEDIGWSSSVQLYYDGGSVDEAGRRTLDLALLTPAGQSTLTVKAEAYGELAERVMPTLAEVEPPSGEWLQVDRDYAFALLGGPEP